MERPGNHAGGQETLRGDAWPGNVRELANTLQKALIFSRGVPIGRTMFAGNPREAGGGLCGHADH